MPRSASRTLGPIFWWLFAGSLLSDLATFVGPFIAFYLTSRGLRPAAIGLVTSGYGVGALVAGPLAGVLSDTIGRRRTLLFSLVGAAGSAAALAFVHSPPLVALLVLLFGAANTAIRPPLRATVADVVPKDEVPRAFGWLYWAANAGASVSLFLGGMLASHGFALPFLCDAATTFAYAVLVFFRIPETRPKESKEKATSRGYRVVLEDGTLLYLLFAIVLTHFVYAQAIVTLPVYMAQLGFTPTAYGTIAAVSAVLVVVLQPFSARILSFAKEGHALAIGAAFIALGNGAQAFVRTGVEFTLAICTWTLGEIAFYATASATVASLAPEEARGRYMAAYGLCLSGSMVLSSATGPALLEQVGPKGFWSGCFAIAAAATALFLSFEKKRARRDVPREGGVEASSP